MGRRRLLQRRKWHGVRHPAHRTLIRRRDRKRHNNVNQRFKQPSNQFIQSRHDRVKSARRLDKSRHGNVRFGNWNDQSPDHGRIGNDHAAHSDESGIPGPRAPGDTCRVASRDAMGRCGCGRSRRPGAAIAMKKGTLLQLAETHKSDLAAFHTVLQELARRAPDTFAGRHCHVRRRRGTIDYNREERCRDDRCRSQDRFRRHHRGRRNLEDRPEIPATCPPRQIASPVARAACP